MEQEKKEKEVQNPSEASNEIQSENKTPKSLKPKSKITKKSPINDQKPKKAKDASQIWRRIRKKKNKNVPDGKKGNSRFEQDSKKITAKEGKQEEDVSNREDAGKSQHSEKNREEIGGSDKSYQKQRSEDKSSQNQKNKKTVETFKRVGQIRVQGIVRTKKNTVTSEEWCIRQEFEGSKEQRKTQCHSKKPREGKEER